MNVFKDRLIRLFMLLLPLWKHLPVIIFLSAIISKMSENKDEEIAEQSLTQLVDKTSEASLKSMPERMSQVGRVGFDPTSPLCNNADDLSDIIISGSTATDSAAMSDHVDIIVKTKEEVQKSAILACASLGVTINQLHLEDLYYILKSRGSLTDYHIWMYLRGIMRTNQITATDSLTKVTASLEGVLAKTQHNMVQNVDSNRIVLEKLTQVSTKFESGLMTIMNTLRADQQSHHTKILSVISELSSQSIPAKSADPPSSNVTLLTSTTTVLPGLEEIKTVMRVISMPEEMISEKAPKYVGKISWAEYEKITSGKLSKKECKKIIISWGSRVLSTA